MVGESQYGLPVFDEPLAKIAALAFFASASWPLYFRRLLLLGLPADGLISDQVGS